MTLQLNPFNGRLVGALYELFLVRKTARQIFDISSRLMMMVLRVELFVRVVTTRRRRRQQRVNNNKNQTLWTAWLGV
jgi:hypothetical protein